MTGVSYALVDFVSGGPILDLPVMQGASWASQLNRADALSCQVDLNDPDARRLDLGSAAAEQKSLLIACNDDDVILAWGLITESEWNEDAQTLELTAGGIDDAYFGSTIIAPASAKTAVLVDPLTGEVTPTLHTLISGYSLGTIGKKLIAVRLAWPGAPGIYPSGPFILQADEIGTHERAYEFQALKRVGKALRELTDVENGPDFAFDAARAPDGMSLTYTLRHGTAANPRIGSHVGAWALGDNSPITGLKLKRNGDDLGSMSWLTAGGKTGGSILIARHNNGLTEADGFAPRDIVDTTHNDVESQDTLDAYARENGRVNSRTYRTTGFTVRGDAPTLPLGSYRTGDTIDIDVPAGHPLIPAPGFRIRVTSISGDETGKDVKIGCVIVDA